LSIAFLAWLYIKTMAKIEPNFMGKDSFFWWVGVVEDRRDPKKLGRLRIRVLGAHTQDKTLIPTCELHWAYPYQPITWNQAMNGLGHTPTGPAEGTWVFGFFKDNQSAQDPVIMGTVAGIPEEAPQPCIGFYDPGKPFHEVDTNAPRKIRTRYYPNDGTGAQNSNESKASLYPRQTHPWGCILGENDVNRLARSEMVDDTIQGVRKRQRDVGRKGEFGGIPIAFVHPKPARKWVEPYPGSHMSDGESKYPYNHVFESESGHIVEIDDTPHKERIFIYHRSGTYIELGAGQEDDVGLHGNFAMKIVGKRFEVTMENAYSHFQNTLNVTVDGEVNLYCRKDVNLQVDGNMNVHVQGDYIEKIHGNKYTDIDGERAVKIGKGDYTSVANGRSVAVGGQLTESAGGHFSMTSGAELSGDAPTVHWNSGHSGHATTSPPVVPPFPAPLDLTEGRNEGGSDPVKEEKPDPTPQECGQKDC
jgi:hypothetical protein